MASSLLPHQNNVTRFFHFGLFPIKISGYTSASVNLLSQEQEDTLTNMDYSSGSHKLHNNANKRFENANIAGLHAQKRSGFLEGRFFPSANQSFLKAL